MPQGTVSVRTVGVEEEFLLVRPGGALAETGDEVARDAAERDDDGQFEHELKRAQAEIASKPTDSLEALADDLNRLRGVLADAAANTGALLLASGTHPNATQPRTTAEHRYAEMTRTFGKVARQQLTCGMHVHVGIDSAEEGVAVIDRVRSSLALLTALSANSPFHDGEDTGYASYRSLLWGQWPTAGQNGIFGDLDTYRRVQRDLISSGAALDPGMLYYDIRLSAQFPTVEIRVADVCPDVQSAVTIAAIARALVETAARDWRAGRAPSPEPTEMLRARSWRAARWGMRGDLVAMETDTVRLSPAWDCVHALVTRLGPWLDEVGDLPRVQEGLRQLRTRGTGAERQRAAFERGGMPAVRQAVIVPPTGRRGSAVSAS